MKKFVICVSYLNVVCPATTTKRPRTLAHTSRVRGITTGVLHSEPFKPAYFGA